MAPGPGWLQRVGVAVVAAVAVATPMHPNLDRAVEWQSPMPEPGMVTSITEEVGGCTADLKHGAA